MSTRAPLGVTALLILNVAACERAPDPAIAQRAATKAAEHVAEGRGGIERMASGLVTVTERAARTMGAAMADPTNVARVRNRLLDLHDDHSEVGRALTLYPTWFIAAVGTDGKAIAGDRTHDRDFLPGRDLGAMFPCVRAALAGTAGSCTGVMPAAGAVPERTYLVAAHPTRGPMAQPVAANADAGAAPTPSPEGINGVVVSAITYGRLAKAVRELLNLRTANERVQLYVGLVRGSQVIPSGRNNNEVAAAYLVPDSLVPRVPRDLDARLGRGNEPVTFNFSENNGQLQWGAAAGRVSALDAETALVVFRTSLR
jgi:hypothetical protein